MDRVKYYIEIVENGYLVEKVTAVMAGGRNYENETYVFNQVDDLVEHLRHALIKEQLKFHEAKREKAAVIVRNQETLDKALDMLDGAANE